MDAKKCDRCGKFYEKYNPTEATARATEYVQLMHDLPGMKRCISRWDLCEDCMKKLVAFLDNSPSQTEKFAEPSVKGDTKGELEATIADLERCLRLLPDLGACQLCKNMFVQTISRMKVRIARMV